MALITSMENPFMRYTLGDLLPFISRITEEPIQEGQNINPVPSSAPIITAPIVMHCAFIQHFRDDAATLCYQDWFAGISNLALCYDGEQKIHEWSSCYHGYSFEETQKMVECAREAAKPVTCEYIRNELGFYKCPNCPMKAPIAWSSSNLGRALFTVEDYSASLNSSDKISSRNLPFQVTSALTTIYMCTTALFEEIFNSLCKHMDKSQTSSLRVQIKKQAEAEEQRQDERRTVRRCSELSEMLGYPVTIPSGFPFTEKGIEKVSKDKRVLILPRLVLPFKRYACHGNELIGLFFQKGKGYGKIIVPRSVLASSGRIIELASHGIPIDTSTALPVVNFFTNFLLANEDHLPYIMATPTLGWQEDDSFVPGLSNIRLIKTGDEFDSTDSLKPRGSLEDWITAMRPLRQYIGSRLAMAASMSAPLLYLLGLRTFIIHLWGPSQGGKTASQKAALSIWLNPASSEGNMVSFNSTRVALEMTLGYLKNLPFVINERQQVGNDQAFLDALLYMLGEGQGRSRGARNGGVRRILTWQTTVITSGEHPLTNEASAEGERTRCLEIYADSFIKDAGLASAMHSLSERYYGTAGPKVLEYVIDNKESIELEFNRLSAEIKANHPNLPGSYYSYIAVLALSEALLSERIFGHTAEESVKNAAELVEHVISSIPRPAPEYMHAYTYLQDWVNQHMEQFREEASRRVGWISENDVLLFPTAFNDVLKEGNFNPSRVRRDLAKYNLLQRSQEEFTVTRVDRFTKRPSRVILLNNFLPNREP